LVWTTDAKASSQASCRVVSGGPDTTSITPTVDQVKTGGEDYYDVTAHSLAAGAALGSTRPLSDAADGTQYSTGQGRTLDLLPRVVGP
jgi:hypothetical protein